MMSDKIKLYNGDCLQVMKDSIIDNSIDSIITDPPYALNFMGKKWDSKLPSVEIWEECLRVAKPGAMLLAFGGTRTYHRLVCNIEDAGWQIRNCITYLYGSGFPKSHNISKAIDKLAGAKREVVGQQKLTGKARVLSGANYNGEYRNCRDTEKGYKESIDITLPATDEAEQWDGYGTALKPAVELICLAMKPCDGTYAENALRHGVAGLNIGGCRIGNDTIKINQFDSGAKPFGDAIGEKYTTITNTQGRWPTNLILDEEAGKMLDKQTGELGKSRGGNSNAGNGMFGDSGGASRFFYCSKASVSERDAGCENINAKSKTGVYKFRIDGSLNTPITGPRRNNHPTVKPLNLMQYLCRMTMTPSGGNVLDPFMGSGTTGMAAIAEGRDFIGIEINMDYFQLAKRRIEYHQRKAVEYLFSGVQGGVKHH